MNAKEAGEKELVKSMLGGEKRAFEEFYKQHKQKLFNYVLRRVSTLVDADEIVQDTFLSFLDSLPLFSFKSSLKTFLYSIARHEVADYFRRKYAKRALKLVPIVGELVSEPLYSTRELSDQIDRVYRKLLPQQAQIIRLKYEEGWSVKEIAKYLKMSVKAVESRLFRARQAFQELYLEIE